MLYPKYQRDKLFADTGRNDPCPCGSMRKFKRCCLNLNADERARIAGSWTLHQRSVNTLDAINYFFRGTNETSALANLRDHMTPDRIREFFLAIATIWPSDLQFDASVRDDSGALRGFFAGMVRPEVVLRNVTRVALYTDAILVPLPFDLPWQLQDQYDPILHPGQYRQDVHRWTFALLMLEPWIRSDIVSLCPDPKDYNAALWHTFQRSAEARSKTAEFAKNTALAVAYVERIVKFDYFRSWLSMPLDALMQRFRELGMTPEDEPGTRDYVENFRRNDIFYLAGVVTGGDSLNRLSIPRIEDTAYICSKAGAFPFTDMPNVWRNILSLQDLSAEAQVWSPLSKAFGELPFDFLDGYDPRFAMEMREDGRLAMFRAFLRRTWRAIDGSPALDKAEAQSRELCDELTQEYRAASADWDAIKNRYSDRVRTSGRDTGVASVIGAGLTGVGGLVTGTLGVALPLVLHLLRSDAAGKAMAGEQRGFRLKVPMSVFIDLETTERARVPRFVKVDE
jgi:hypothetical protein